MRIGLCCGAVVERTLGLDLHDPSSNGHLSSFRPKKMGAQSTQLPQRLISVQYKKGISLTLSLLPLLPTPN